LDKGKAKGERERESEAISRKVNDFGVIVR